MSQYVRHILLLSVACLFCAGLTSCSDSPTTPPPAGDPADTIPPLVRALVPNSGDVQVQPDFTVRVYFSEAMDPSTVDVTLSSGGDLTYEWLDGDRALYISHATPWAAGEMITATVGTGLQDLAGNTLPQAFSETFFVAADNPMHLFTEFTGDAESMVLNGSIVLYFNAQMQLASITDNTTIQELPPVGNPAPEFTVDYRQGNSYQIAYEFPGGLAPTTTYQITLAGAALAYGGEALGADVLITFTTGSTADETGPQILSVTPAVGAVVPADLDKVVITFTEPVDLTYAEPHNMSALLTFFMVSDPVWNAAHDEVTLYLQQALPAGVRLYGVYGAGELYDMVGNTNALADSLSFTTVGEADIFPVRDDLKLYYFYDDSDGPEYHDLRQTMTNITGDTFTRELHYRDKDGYNGLYDMWPMSKTAAGLKLEGLMMADTLLAATPAIDFLPLPTPATWSGSATFNDGETSFVMDYKTTVGETYRTRVQDDYKIRFPSIWLDDCLRVTVEYSLIAAGEQSPRETGMMEFELAPGLGIFGERFDRTEWVDGQETVQLQGYYAVFAARVDDLYELE